jgi:putative drug exporter of the RND superfamily
MLEALGRFSYRRRWLVVIAWLVVFGAAAVIAPRVTGILQGGGYTIGNSQSVAAYNTLNRAYGYRALVFNVVFAGRQQDLMPAARRFRAQATARLGASLAVSAPRYTPDRKVVFERVFSQPQSDFGAHDANILEPYLPRGAVRGYLAGPSAIFRDMEVVSDQDLRNVEIVTLPIAAVVLLLIFGSLVASATPVLMAPLAVTLSLAIIYFIGHRVDMSIFVLNTASMLGLGVAIDYSLLMVNRFREELALGRDLETAVGHTVEHAGKAILVSAIVVSIGFFGLTLSGVSMLRSLGIGGSLVTILSLIVALTFLPALLGIIGHRVNRFSLVPERLTTRGFWHALAWGVMRRPVRIILAVVVVVLVIGIPALHLRVGVPGPEILPTSVESRAGNDILNRHLGVANSQPVLVTVVRKPGTPVSTAQTTSFAVLDRICSSPVVVGVSSVPVPNSPTQIRSCTASLNALQNVSPTQVKRARAVAATHRVGLISVFLNVNASSRAAEGYVSKMRAQPPIRGYRILIGGQTAGQMDFDNYLYSRFPLIALAVVMTIFFVLLIAFRSLLLPLKAILMNVFSVLAAYGAIVWAFQDGHLAGVLNFTTVGNIDSIVPVFLFTVLFGVSTDYEVFLLTRVQEEYRRTGDNDASVARGLEVTGRIITSAAVVMIVVFAAFSFARLVVIQEVGFGLAVAVLLDATLIRALLVPATMKLLGRWNWWLPGRGFLAPPSEPSGHSTAAR